VNDQTKPAMRGTCASPFGGIRKNASKKSTINCHLAPTIDTGPNER
jgi:hypothetical protein